MEMSENDSEDNGNNNMVVANHCQSFTDSSSIFDESPKFSRRKFNSERTPNGSISFYIKDKNNIPRKNLMKVSSESN